MIEKSGTNPHCRIKVEIKRFLAIVLTVIITAAMLTFPAFADSAEDEKWGWPLDGLYTTLIHAFQNGLSQIFQGAFNSIDDTVNKVRSFTVATPDNFESVALNNNNADNVFSLVENVAKNVMVPIAAIIAALLIMYEFICALMEKNNLHEFETSVIVRYIMKTALTIWFLASVFDIVNAIFGLGIFIVEGISGELTGSESNLSTVYEQIHTVICGTDPNPEVLDGIGINTGIAIFFPTLLLYLVSWVMALCSYILLIGRMMEIYLHLAVSPVPFATITNREFGDIGKNYVKTLFAYVLHGAFIMLCCIMYVKFTLNLSTDFSAICNAYNADNNFNLAEALNGKLLEISAFGALMIFAMFKSSSIAKSIVGAH